MKVIVGVCCRAVGAKTISEATPHRSLAAQVPHKCGLPDAFPSTSPLPLATMLHDKGNRPHRIIEHVHSAMDLPSPSSADFFFAGSNEELYPLWSKRSFDPDTYLDRPVSAISSRPRKTAHIIGPRSRMTQNPSLFPSLRRRRRQFGTLAFQ